ncbi:hypothetical protein WN51_09079 [Melipona quadrifasciata]|uniref:Uncharacterized protein n=1 Tax=Melipona quadrifasciata TaxID=166423 RepID=A0A0M9A8B1_9HYME|nr:hypothetical protein WN51_09079 [Melipona quadrifasciata]
MDAIAAIANEITTAGPAVVFETDPASTYTPTPSVEPIPRAVRSNVDRHLANPVSRGRSTSFLRLNVLYRFANFQFFMSYT